jgi:hypothetical protein
MQHALALNLTTESTDLSAAFDPRNLAKLCRTAIVDGYRVDKGTSEVYGEFVTSHYQSNIEQYEVTTIHRNSTARHRVHPVITETIDNVVHVDFRGSDNDNKAPNEIAPKKNPRGAGRRPASTNNPIAHIAVELLTNDPGEPHPLWLDNIIFGSCLTAAGQSQNVCNVAMSEVVGALYLREFKVDTLVAQGTLLRKAQRIIKAARHAAHGIHHYLTHRPALLQLYEDAAKVEARLGYSVVPLVYSTPLQAIPQHIKDVYAAGNYLACGEAVRAFRRSCS